MLWLYLVLCAEFSYVIVIYLEKYMNRNKFLLYKFYYTYIDTFLMIASCSNFIEY
jgi:hypothetical protein